MHIDYKGPLNPKSSGRKYILVIVDAFSKFIQAYPTKNCSAKTTITMLKHWFYKFGPPDRIVSDRGSSFLNHEFIDFCYIHGVENKFLSGYNPQANGQVETMNQHIGAYLRCITGERIKRWSLVIEQFCFAYNTSIVSVLKMSPFQIMFNRKPKTPNQFKLGTLRKANRQCKRSMHNYCDRFGPHCHEEKNLLTKSLRTFMHEKPLTQEMMDRESDIIETF